MMQVGVLIVRSFIPIRLVIMIYYYYDSYRKQIKVSLQKIHFFFFIYNSLRQIVTQQNLRTFGITIQVFGHSYGSHHSIVFNDDQIVLSIIGDMGITQQKLA